MESDIIVSLKKEKRKYLKKSDLDKVAETCNCLGVALSDSGEFSEALSEHRDALDLYKSLDNLTGVATSYRCLGEVYSLMGNYEKALQEHDHYLKVAEQLECGVEQQRALTTIGNDHITWVVANRKDKNVNQAITKAEEAFKLALHMACNLKTKISKKEYFEMKARCLHNLGLVYEYSNNEIAALQHYQDTLALAQEHDLEEDMISSLFTYASYLCKLQKYDVSLQHLEKLLKLLGKVKDEEKIKNALLLKVDVYIKKSDFTSAKQTMIQVFKMDKRDKEVEKKLKRVIKMVRYIEDIQIHTKQQKNELIKSSITKHLTSKTNSDININENAAKNNNMDARVLCKLYEKLGDNAVKFKNYQFALNSYKNMEVCMKKVGASSDEMSEVYSSIWVTLKDLERYAEALSYLEKDLKLTCHNDDKLCELHLKKCEILMKCLCDHTSIKSSFDQAFNVAHNAHNNNLKCMVLSKLLKWQIKENVNSEEVLLTKQNLKELGGKNDKLYEETDESQVMDDDEEYDDDDESDVDLEREIDFCSDNDEDEDEIKARNMKKKKNQFLKLNKYGETLLQTACISGDLKKVKSYITQQGCPINHRDHSGWLPIHDAANQGFSEIVEVLIEAGSLVDDRGGKDCGGFTPLHSACANGHIQVVDVILKKGFREILIRRSDENELAIDLLEDYIKNNTTTTELEEYLKKMKDLTQEELDRQASIIKHPSRLPNNGVRRNSLCDLKKENASKRKSLQNTFHDDLDVDEDRMLLNPKTAKAAYKSAISSLMNPTSTKIKHKIANKYNGEEDYVKKKLPAIVAEKDLVSDDWLVDDDEDIEQDSECVEKENRNISNAKYRKVLEKNNKKRSSKEEGNEKIKKKKLNDEKVCEIQSNNEQKYRNNITSEDDIIHTSNNIESSDVSLKIICGTSPLNNKEKKSSNFDSSIGNGDKNQKLISTAAVSQSWVRVKIEDATVMIPITVSDVKNKTVGWLANEASKRFYKCYSSRPNLSLQTLEGVALFNEDCLSGVVMFDHNSQLEGLVLDWHEVSMETKYTDACTAFNATAYSNIRCELTDADTTGFVNLSFKNIQAIQLQPILHVLQSLNNLSELHLSGNKLRDAGFKNLVNKLSNLSVLDVSNNLLTHQSMTHLLSAVSSTKQSFQNLERLHLSQNHLTDHSSNALIQSLNLLPAISSLYIDECHFTSSFFANHNSLKSLSLRMVNLNKNNLYDLSSPSLFTLFNPAVLTTIKISTVSSTFLSSVREALSFYKDQISLRYFCINGQTALLEEFI